MNERAGLSIAIPVSPGELVDKITILEIKAERIAEEAKLASVRTELNLLRAARDRAARPSAELARLTADLKHANEALWEIEDRIRDCERSGDFGPRFIELARAVYRTNDERAAIKRRINLLLGAAFLEEKSYRPY